MKKLTMLDSGFLLLEKRNQPLHVAYLNLYSPPADAGPDFVQKLVERLRSYAALPPFNQRLQSPFGIGAWVEDPEFDIDQHVIHISLPRPGRIRELLSMVSRMHSSHLDRAYPLWRIYVIEGLEGNRIATYSKVHHSVADGVAGTRLVLKSMSSSPDEILPPSWSIPPAGRRKPDSLLSVPLNKAAHLAEMARSALTGLPGVARELRLSYREYREQHPQFLSGLSAPACILNQRISASRRFAAQSFAYARVRDIARTLELTTNDVVLGICSYALRKYLLQLNALPDKPLLALVPMSTRRDNSDSGNQIAFMQVSLATHLDDPEDRMRAIKESIDHGKQRFAALSPAEMFGYAVTMMTPGLFNMLATAHPQRLPFNLVISNVPGPKGQMYWQGCKLEGMYPVSAIADGMALNITLTRRHDSLDFGLIGCRRTLPHLQSMLEYLEEGLAEMEKLARLTPATDELSKRRLSGSGR
jgi:diacylglycerol O-acyltransferase